MQRRSFLAQSRHRQLASELNRYGMSIVKDVSRVLVEPPTPRVIMIPVLLPVSTQSRRPSPGTVYAA